MYKKIFVLLFVLSLFFLNGCYAVVTEKIHERNVKGFGIDVNFYPFPSIRFGYFDYTIILEKNENEKISK